MQAVKQSSKDKIFFLSKEEASKPSKYTLPPSLPDEQKRGVVMPDGTLNWTCPCLGGLPYGPCGYEFREFFGCLHNKEKENQEKQECFPQFTAMRECFKGFPKLYPPEDDELDELKD